MSTEKEIVLEGNASCDSADDREDMNVGSLRRRKIVKCAKNKIEQGFLFQ